MTCVPPLARSARTGTSAPRDCARPGTPATIRGFTAGTGVPLSQRPPLTKKIVSAGARQRTVCEGVLGWTRDGWWFRAWSGCCGGGGRLGGLLVGGDGDGQAEGLQALQVGADLLVPVDVAGVPVRAEVVVAGLRVGQQVPDDECDTRSHMLRANLADWRASMT